jgi:hypothetical protein
MTTLYHVIAGKELSATQRRAVTALIHLTERTLGQLAFYFDTNDNYLGIYRDL